MAWGPNLIEAQRHFTSYMYAPLLHPSELANKMYNKPILAGSSIAELYYAEIISSYELTLNSGSH